MSKKVLVKEKMQKCASRSMLEVMSYEEQKRLIDETYSHPYGVFIRLSLISGLRPEELLGLQWDDVDIRYSKLRVRYEQREDSDGLNLHSARFPRFVPLLPHTLKDLMDWKMIQEKAIATMPPYYWGCKSVTMMRDGNLMDMGMLQNLLQEFLRKSHLRDYPLCALREAFVARALEQGVHPANLSRV